MIPPLHILVLRVPDAHPKASEEYREEEVHFTPCETVVVPHSRQPLKNSSLHMLKTQRGAGRSSNTDSLPIHILLPRLKETMYFSRRLLEAGSSHRLGLKSLAEGPQTEGCRFRRYAEV